MTAELYGDAGSQRLAVKRLVGSANARSGDACGIDGERPAGGAGVVALSGHIHLCCACVCIVGIRDGVVCSVGKGPVAKLYGDTGGQYLAVECLVCCADLGP